MKIGIDARMYGPRVSGIGNYVKNLIDSLLKIDSENEYIIFMLKDGFDEFKPIQKNVKKVMVDCKWYTLREQRKYWRICEKEKIDVMHFPNFNVPLLYTRKFVVTIHDMTPWHFPGNKVASSSVRWLAYATVFNSAIKRAEKVITVSEFSKEEIIKKYTRARKKIEVVYNGVSASFQRIDNYGIINLAKEKYGIKKPYIFFIGVWRDHKNIPGLIQAFTILCEKYKMDMQLVLGGDKTKSSKEIELEIQKSSVGDNIIATGFIPDADLPAIYSGAELTVIPSFIEGFGMHAIESLQCKTPVVGSKTTSLPEILGDCAVYFDPYEPSNMAEVIYNVLLDDLLKKSLIEKGQKIIQKYSWDECAKKTLQIYKNIH